MVNAITRPTTLDPRQVALLYLLLTPEEHQALHRWHSEWVTLDSGYQAGDCPNAEKLAAQCLSLPMYPELKDAQVERVLEILNLLAGSSFLIMIVSW